MAHRSILDLPQEMLFEVCRHYLYDNPQHEERLLPPYNAPTRANVVFDRARRDDDDVRGFVDAHWYFNTSLIREGLHPPLAFNPYNFITGSIRPTCHYFKAYDSLSKGIFNPVWGSLPATGPLSACITHLWVCIDQRAQDWGHRAPLPDVFLGYLEMHLNALDQDPNHDLERFEIEWDTSDNPWPAGPFCFAPNRPWQRLRRARRYGYIVGRKVGGMWNVRFFDRRGQGSGYKWNEGKVDDMDPVDSFTDARIRVRRLLNLATEEFWFQ